MFPLAKCEKQKQVQIDRLNRLFAHVKINGLWLAASSTARSRECVCVCGLEVVYADQSAQTCESVCPDLCVCPGLCVGVCSGAVCVCVCSHEVCVCVSVRVLGSRACACVLGGCVCVCVCSGRCVLTGTFFCSVETLSTKSRVYVQLRVFMSCLRRLQLVRYPLLRCWSPPKPRFPLPGGAGDITPKTSVGKYGLANVPSFCALVSAACITKRPHSDIPGNSFKTVVRDCRPELLGGNGRRSWRKLVPRDEGLCVVSGKRQSQL